MTDIKVIAERIIKKLKDPRQLGLAAFVVVVLLITWSGVKAVQDNYQLENQIAKLQEENAVQKLKDQNLMLQNQYYNSNQYLELAARQNFGLAAPGEKVLIVPRSVAMSYIKKTPVDKTADTGTHHQPFFIRNLQSWWDFFRGRQAKIK